MWQMLSYISTEGITRSSSHENEAIASMIIAFFAGSDAAKVVRRDRLINRRNISIRFQCSKQFEIVEAFKLQWTNICYIIATIARSLFSVNLIHLKPPSHFMKFKTLRPNFHLIAQAFFIFLALLLLSCDTYGQKKKSSKPLKGYATASYTLSSSEQYMHDWLIAGPVLIDGKEPDEQAQSKFFKAEPPLIAVVPEKPIPPLQINGKEFPWQSIRATADIVDLDKQFQSADFAAAFALAEIKADKEIKTFLSVGSDDGIRIWHNGKLIHDNWIPRGVTIDEDLVPITLIKGSNQILLKIQDIRGGWGFVARLLNTDALSEKLIAAARQGRIDEVNLLLEAGANLEKKNSSGLTALSNARLHGRDEVAQLLLNKGAKESPIPTPDVLINGTYGFLNGKEASGVAILVSKDGKVIYKNGFGYADIDKKELIKPDTKFRIGSITKQFTAASILKLQQEGKIAVADKLSKFIPDFPRAEEVTIHHLLTHTSGIHSYTGKDEFLTKVVSPISEEELIRFFKNDTYDFNPGESWQYNNSGYFLLGYIIGKVTGKPYGQYLKETFFDPLGMTNTGVHNSTLKLANEAKGYTKENDKYKLAVNWDMSWAGAAGAIYSTVEDLDKWNEAVFNGKVLQKESLNAALTPVVLNNGELPADARYGYGWALGDYRGKKIVEHGGGLHGFLSQLARFPEENVTVVILTNLTPPEVMIETRTIAEFVLWDKMDKQKSLVVNASVSEDVKQFEGRYNFPNAGVMIISSEDNNLYAQLTGQPKFQIFPAGDGEYFWKVVQAKIKFIKNEKGEVEYGDFEQNGHKLKVAKLKDEPIVSIDKALFKLYAGKYDYGNNFVITVFIENDKLYAQGSNQPRFEILPLSEKEFTLRELNAKLTFVQEPDGKISKLVLDMAGQKKDAVKME
jgi:CubicO group peptidase (beta-lactamase class C family)